MKIFTKIYVLVILALSAANVLAQDIDPLIVLDSAQNKIQNIKSYTADAEIDVDVDFLQMSPRKAKITYEYPNKLDIDTKGFIMIPKYGFRPFMKTIANEDNMVVFAGREEIDGNNCFILKLLPKVDGKIVMIKLWVRVDDYLIRRSETFTRRSGSFLIDFIYGKEVLPDKMIFKFETKGINMPWKIMGNSIDVDEDKFKDADMKTGTVTIVFGNYIINYDDDDR
ncbi:MAG: outer membrane lipoprotein-sorting protein [Chlorobi bacterium]|nr:outer membrane lipoprotein-sorting protein [Chlorobiota bacterium]